MNIYLILLFIFLGMVYLGLFWVGPIISMIKFSLKDGLQMVGILHACFGVAVIIVGVAFFLLYKSGVLQ